MGRDRAWLLAAAMTAGGLSAGCGAGIAEAAFASDFSCGEGVTSEASAAPGRYVVEGCGRRATYQCVGNYESTCVLQTTSDESRTASDETPARVEAAPLKSEVEVQNKGGSTEMVLELRLEKRGLLRLTAVPDRADVVQLKLVRTTEDAGAAACNLDWMVNGQVIQMPKAVSAKKGSVVAQRVQIGHELIRELGMADAAEHLKLFDAADEPDSIDAALETVAQIAFDPIAELEKTHRALRRAQAELAAGAGIGRARCDPRHSLQRQGHGRRAFVGSLGREVEREEEGPGRRPGLHREHRARVHALGPRRLIRRPLW